MWQPYPTFVYGNVSPKDVSEIKSVLHHNLRVSLFPEFTWANAKRLPGSIRIYTGQQIQAVSALPDGGVEVNVRYRREGKGPRAEIYRMAKTSNGWTVISTQLLVD
jgi:hypothetical protein